MSRFRSAMSLLLVLVSLAGLIAIPVSAADTHPITYKLTGNQKQDTLGIARSQVGYTEGKNNSTKYGTWYHLPNKAWCGTFISWCMRKAEVSKSVVKNAAVAHPSRFGLKYRDSTTRMPEAGDLFFTKKFSHVGFVYYVDGDYFYTIEGNSNNDGSNDGTRVLCNKRLVADYYFSTPEYEGEEFALPAPQVSVSKKTSRVYDPVKFSWTPVSGATSYTLILYYNGDIQATVDLGKKTEYSIKPQKTGDYLVSVAANFSDGKSSFGQSAATIVPQPKLSVYYHPNTGSFPEEKLYKVAGEDGVNIRSSYSTSAKKLANAPMGTVLKVTKTKTSGSYLWGYTTYNGISGWSALNRGICQQVGYYTNDKGQIMEVATGQPLTTVWEFAQNQERVLESASTLGMSKQYHTFVGWSDTADGSGVLHNQIGMAIFAEDVYPAFAYEDKDKDIVLYAQWKKTVNAVTLQATPTKTQYYTGEALNTSGMKLQVSYADGTSETVTSGFSLSGYSTQKAGTETVTVTYEGKKVTFDIQVQNRLSYEIKDGMAIITGYVETPNGGLVIIPAKLDGVAVKQIAADAFGGCKKSTGVILPKSLQSVGEGAFADCSSLTTVYYTGSEEQWQQITVGDNNEPLTRAALYTDYQVVGDFNADMKVDYDDVLYLLWHTLFEEDFPIEGKADFNESGTVDYDDVLHLLWHTLYPEDFPLTAAVRSTLNN